MSEQFRLAEILGSLSLATDLSAGQMPESAIGATVLSVRLGKILGLSNDDLEDTYYTCVSRFIGCTSTAMEAASLGLGDDLSLNYAMTLSDPVDADSVRSKLESHFALDVPAKRRHEAIESLLELLPQLPYVGAHHCEQAVALATRLPIPANVAELLCHMESRWDGKNPTKSAGTDLPVIARIVEFAVVAELYRRAGGISAVIEMARLRSGGQFDPEICALTERNAAGLFSGFGVDSNWELYLEAEPSTPRMVSTSDLSTIATAFADFTDNKSPWFLGHSRQVAELVDIGARALGLSEEECSKTKIAAWLHDIGRSAVPNGIWDKPSALSAMELRQVQSHSYQTESILALSPVFSNLLDIACSAQERCDGSGYHRHSKLENSCAGLLAVANMYDALTHDRPWREAFSESEAADMLRAEVSEHRLPREPVRVILEAAGHRKGKATSVYPDNLTKRESEVLALLARGLATKEIAARLFISPKTADNHIQKVYEKTGARSRTAAAMYALKHGLIEI
jgi:HD-GYP domain-containing protein (c-di-GMP phosphodiesterase class II)